MKSEWIPVAQKVPPFGEEVLLSCEHEGHKWITFGFFAEYPDYDSPEEDATYTQWELDRALFFVNNDNCVKAWMSMPEPYEESEE